MTSHNNSFVTRYFAINFNFQLPFIGSYYASQSQKLCTSLSEKNVLLNRKNKKFDLQLAFMTTLKIK